MTIQERWKLPLIFRREAVEAILGYVVAGESCIVLGMGSVGKSNLMRFLQRKDMLQDKLGEDWPTCLFVYIDANKLLERSSWGLAELMLHQLIVSLIDHGCDQASVEAIDAFHERSVSPSTRSLALRYLERAIGIVCSKLELRIVFLIDEFDIVCQMLSAHTFAVLRALRDDYKYRLVYVLASRHNLGYLRGRAERIEPFEELVSPYTIWLGPYSEEDAYWMVCRLEARHNIPIEEEIKRQLLSATGGHPGLLRVGYQVATECSENLIEVLASDSRVQDECMRIWHSLSSDEQKAIKQLGTYGTLRPNQAGTLERLRQKQILGGPWVGPDAIFSPLFERYAKGRELVAGAYVQIDPGRRAIIVEGRRIEELPPLEFKFIEYLARKRNQVCSRDELAQYLYPDDMAFDGKGVSDARLDAIVKRVRERIEPVPGNPQYIVTVRGHGFRLVDDQEQIDRSS